MKCIPGLLAVMMAAVWLGGCLAYIEKPLSGAEQSSIDPALLGTWQAVEEDGEKISIEVTAENIHHLHIAFSSTSASGRVTNLVYRAHASEIEGKRYLNVSELKSGNAGAGFMVVKYSTEAADELSVALLDEDVVKKAIRDGRLAGMIEASSEFGDATITAQPAETGGFLLQHDAELFPRTVILRRAVESSY